MKVFSLLAMALAVTSTEARLGNAEKQQQAVATVTPLPAPAKVTTPTTTTTAAAPATTVAAPAAPKKPAATTPSKCLQTLNDGDVALSFDVVGGSAWEGPEGQNPKAKITKNFVQKNMRFTNSGTKPICGVELSIPAKMDVYSQYGGLVKSGATGLTATVPQFGQIGAGATHEFGFILTGDDKEVGQVCVTKVNACT